MFGMFIVLLTLGFMLFAYLFLIGSVIGLVLFAIQWVKNKLQHPQEIKKTQYTIKRKRIIDVSDWKRH